MNTIYNLIKKGEDNLTKADLQKLGAMAKAAEKYEDETLDLQPQLSKNFFTKNINKKCL